MDGLRVEFRLIVSHAPEQRFDANGVELLQFRGKVADMRQRHPEAVVRFSGRQRDQLYRWCAVGKHMSVVGQLEVKTYTANDGVLRIILLIEASDIHPLNPDEVDHAREGVYAALGRTARVAPPLRTTRQQREASVRRMLETDDGGG